MLSKVDAHRATSWQSLQGVVTMRLVRPPAAICAHTTRTYSTVPQRLSRVFVPTCSADAIAASDTLESLKLLLRGGYVRQSGSGTYSFLPMGLRMLNKIVRIIEEEMDAVRCHY